MSVRSISAREERLGALEAAYDERVGRLGVFSDPKMQAIGAILPDMVEQLVESQRTAESVTELFADLQQAMEGYARVLGMLETAVDRCAKLEEIKRHLLGVVELQSTLLKEHKAAARRRERDLPHL